MTLKNWQLYVIGIVHDLIITNNLRIIIHFTDLV
jgi:hypothetical protein